MMVARTISVPDLPVRVQAFPALRATHLWLFGTAFDLAVEAAGDDVRALLLARVAADGATAGVAALSAGAPAGLGAAIEQALLGLADRMGVARDPVARAGARRALFPAEVPPPRVTSIDNGPHGVTVTMTGAVEAVLPSCTQYLDDQGRAIPLTPWARRQLRRAAADRRAWGSTVLAVAHRAMGAGYPAPDSRGEAERDLVLIGLVALEEPVPVAGAAARTLAAVPPLA